MIAYDRVWRTGANAATQFTTLAPITLGRLSLPAGKYTLWTVPHLRGVHLIVNRQTGQWGTEYSRVQFTIAIESSDARHGTLVIAWGTFRWTAPFVVLP